MLARLAPLTVLIAVLIGHVTDATTGQPLAGVRISAGRLHATTDADGLYRLSGLKPGQATLAASSGDVPPQRFAVTVRSGTTRRDLIVCSTTLDYHCGTPSGVPGGG